MYKFYKSKAKDATEHDATNFTAKNNLQIQKISEEIERVATESADIINQIPRDYRYYSAVQFLESVLANGRADNMKEAINLYEDKLHKMRLEKMSEQMLRENEQQSRMLNSIEENSSRAAVASEINTVFSVLSFLDRL